MRSTACSGFTLVEMLVVLVLISISIALVYPNLLGIRDSFDTLLDKATAERNQKKEAFAQFISDGLPQKTYSSATRP